MTAAPGTTGPGTIPLGTIPPGTTAPGTTAPGTTAPGTTAPGTTAVGTTAPGTTPVGTTAPSTTAPGTTSASAPVTSTDAGVPSTPPTVPTSGTAPGAGQKVCDKFGSTNVDDGAYLVQNNEWGASDGQCITTNAGPGFSVDSGDHHKGDSPAAYPSIMSGCWMGTCTKGTTLPTQIGKLPPLSSSIAGTIPAGVKSNLAYDIWADSAPKKDGGNDAMELMIWLKETGGIAPIGSKSATVSVGGATWDVWKGTNGGVNVISYVRQGYVDAADNLPITDFVKDAVKQGSVKDTDYLTNIQAGFEPWTGGPGLALTKFAVGDSQDAVASSGVAASPTSSSTPAGSAEQSPGGSVSPTSSPSGTATSASKAPDPNSSGAAGGASGAEWLFSNGLAGFQSTPWNNEGASDPVAAASPNVSGRQAVKFVVPGGGKRSEAQPENSEYKAGDHKFFGYSAYLDKNFAVDANSWQVIWQLHDGGSNGSPPVALEVGGGKLWLATSGNDHDKDLGAVEAGQDVAVQMEVQFAQGGGLVNVWRDGKQVLSNYQPPKGTMVDGSDYLKTGIYRDPSQKQSSTLYLNDLKVGDSLSSVGDLAGQNASSGGAAAPAAGALLVLAPLLGLEVRRRRRHRVVLPRPRAAFAPPSRAAAGASTRTAPREWPESRR